MVPGAEFGDVIERLPRQARKMLGSGAAAGSGEVPASRGTRKTAEDAGVPSLQTLQRADLSTERETDEGNDHADDEQDG